MTTTIAAEVNVYGEIVFEEEGDYLDGLDDGGYFFDIIRDDIINRIENMLDPDLWIEERLVDGWESELIIRNAQGDRVGEGYIKA